MHIEVANRELCCWDGVSYEIHYWIKDVAWMQRWNWLLFILFAVGIGNHVSAYIPVNSMCADVQIALSPS